MKWPDDVDGDVSFTEKHGQYLSFISNYMKLNGRPPAEADMQKYFGVTPPTAHQMVVRLESLGLIKRTPGVGRSIQLLVPSDEIPSLK
jgi:Mn-dependent DtxR family transcriptional regulator